MIRTLLVLLLASSSAMAAPRGTRRLAVVAGADDGGAGRARLRYAVSDARGVAAVLRELGGVEPRDLSILEQSSRAELSRALAALKARVAEARATAERVELILYYSGHSDEEGLLLRGERFPYAELLAALDGAGADVRVAILDSCASGALTRVKGGVRRPAFLLDASRDVRGRAILTSASADEAAQESDRIGGSFFTHYLVSGLRGAADSAHTGRVTLNDAYRFAFAETLARTQSTRAGPQHPAYDIALNGSGDLVLTDLHSAGSTLVLSETLAGRVYVRDASDRLVIELRKERGDAVRLGLEPGSYRIAVEAGGTLRESRIDLSRGDERAPSGFSSVEREPVAVRGAGDARRLRVNVSLVPPLSANAPFGYRTENTIALDLLVGDAAALHGVQVSGIGSRNGEVRGLQVAGVGNWVDGAAYDGSGDARALQLAGTLNWVDGSLRGAQVAGSLNVASSVSGLQLAGALNMGRHVSGAQLAGAMNAASDVVGLQVAGAVNVASEVDGAQVAGGLNVASGAARVQVAPVNVARRRSLVQVGVVNYAEDADVTVGLLSWVKRGTHDAALAVTEHGTSLEVDSGGRLVYGILSAGSAFRLDSRERWLLGFGIGWRALARERVSLDVQAVTSSDVDGWSNGRRLSSARAVLSVRVAGPLAVFAGPTFNVFVDPEASAVDPAGYGWSVGSDVRLWPGAFAGLRLL